MGGIFHKHTNNVYSKMKQDMNGFLEGVLLIFYLVLPKQNSIDIVFSINIEVIVMKYFSSFILFELSSYICDYIDILYSWILLHSKLFWLSLSNAVERIFNVFEVLMSCSNFWSPHILVDFLNNPLSNAYYFLEHSFQHLFSNRIMQIERKANCFQSAPLLKRNCRMC